MDVKVGLRLSIQLQKILEYGMLPEHSRTLSEFRKLQKIGMIDTEHGMLLLLLLLLLFVVSRVRVRMRVRVRVKVRFKVLEIGSIFQYSG